MKKLLILLLITNAEQTDIVTKKDGTDLPLITEWSEPEIEFLKALYDIN